MTAYWSGKCCIFCDNTNFWASGVLTTDLNGGAPDFVMTSNNESVTSALLVNELVMVGGKIVLINLCSLI